MSPNRLKICEVASILNRSDVEEEWSLKSKDKRIHLLFVPINGEKFLTSTRIVTKTLVNEEGFYVELRPEYYEKVSVSYLMFEIGSISGYVALFFNKNKRNFEKRLKKQQLLDFEFREESWEAQEVYGYSAFIVSILSGLNLEHEGNKYLQLRLSMFVDIRDSLSIVQIMEPSFKERVDLNLFNSWKDLLDTYDKDLKSIFKALLDNETKVMNDVRKVRIVVKNLISFVRKKQDHGEMED